MTDTPAQARAEAAKSQDKVIIFDTTLRDGEQSPGATMTHDEKLEIASLLDEMGVERWQRIFNVNVIGSLLCCRAAVLRMSTRHGGAGGAIVNMSSRAAVFGSPGIYVDYAASKGAIDSLTVGLARELIAEGIRVNGVRPGIIDTEIHASGGTPDRARQMAPLVPMQRAGSADEVAQAILWLMSDASSYTTGAVIDVTGGR